ncbi:IclR family transcriptional regulator [Cytobacillus purgationiresistens]|uniref:DNA-binding IclR family transcriptional regulator n=1 Tax=Cytobacillus purgationiresistens TaxID=863449 RepID=A0ABU0AEK0_9BACI|nr:IclR family transcriptional regulator [Cytobacillus purgationiresistens]MDQ0269681.1 DNA-binding IclR family transcriptional regulator [Cytobacillus purgationiresistens]
MEKKKEEKKEKRKYNVPAVDSAFKILTLLSRKKFSKSNLTEIAKALSLTPTTCYRVLQKLEELSVIRYDQSSKRYSLGPYLVVLGERAKENILDLSVIEPYMEEITEETGLTSFLVNRIGQKKSTIISKVEAEQFGINVSVGRHFSVVDGAYGKSLLAFMDEDESDELIRMNDGLRPLSEEEISNLKEELKEVREKGYAIAFGEYIEGIAGVAAPIFNNRETVEMSIALVGMTTQLKGEEAVRMGERIKKVADEISYKLGGRVPFT